MVTAASEFIAEATVLKTITDMEVYSYRYRIKKIGTIKLER